jgi:hypothetical protein
MKRIRDMDAIHTHRTAEILKSNRSFAYNRIFWAALWYCLLTRARLSQFDNSGHSRDCVTFSEASTASDPVSLR